jgi:transcriptional regulator GlxA family with amidase domain
MDQHPVPPRTPKLIGILLFDGVEELDAVGPWEVLADWSVRHPSDGWQVACISAGGRSVTGANGLVLGAHHAIDTAPPLDVLLHPGGPGARPLIHDAPHLDWVRAQRAVVPLLTSVSTGSLVYAAAGLLRWRVATTHWASLNLLSELDPTIRTDVSAHFVDDGDLVTSAGVSAGIDMALHLVDRLAGAERAADVRRSLQYDARPPV